MNKQQRKQLMSIHDRLDEIKSDIELIKEEEEDKHGNLPENLQNSEKGEKFENAISALEDAISDIDNALENITTACGE